MKSSDEIRVIEWIDLENNKRIDLIGGCYKGSLYKEPTRKEWERRSKENLKALTDIIIEAQNSGVRLK